MEKKRVYAPPELELVEVRFENSTNSVTPADTDMFIFFGDTYEW